MSISRVSAVNKATKVRDFRGSSRTLQEKSADTGHGGSEVGSDEAGREKDHDTFESVLREKLDEEKEYGSDDNKSFKRLDYKRGSGSRV